MDQIVTAQHKADAKHLRNLLALYQEVQLLIRVGEYQRGQDPQRFQQMRLLINLLR